MHTLTLGSVVADDDWSPLKDETLAFRIDFQVNALEKPRPQNAKDWEHGECWMWRALCEMQINIRGLGFGSHSGLGCI